MKKSLFYAMFIATLSLVACNKDKPTPSGPNKPDGQIEIPDADLQLVMDRTTKVLYYGDRKTEGVYNYFLGLGDMEFIKDEDGDDAAASGGHIIYFDIYASEGTDSFDTAVLPDGKYDLSETNAAGTLNNYYTRMQINEEGKQKSVDFVDGYLDVKTSSKGKVLTAFFTLKDGSTISCIYEGALVFGDPNAGSEPVEGVKELSSDIDATFTYALGIYYGDAYNSGVDNYTISLTSQILDEDGYATTGGAWVDLSFYTEAGSSIYLAPGVYKVADSYAAGTVEMGFALMGEIWGSSAAMIDVDGNTLEESPIASGEVTISEYGDFGYKIELNLVADNGKLVKGTYAGEFDFEDNSPAEETNTTLTGDYTLTLPSESTTVGLVYYGDYYGVGLANWVLSIENEGADAIDIELLTEMTSTTEIPLPEKQYNFSSDNSTVGVVPGASSAMGQSGTWYWDLSTLDEEGYIYGFAAAIDGWVKLAKDGDKTTVSFEFVDSQYNLFSGTWTGVIPAAEDKSDISTSLAARKYRAAVKTHGLKRMIRRK